VSTRYTYRDGRAYRAGLVYETEYVSQWGDAPTVFDREYADYSLGEEVWMYEPDGVFYVDGIRYERPTNSDIVYSRPMIEVFLDAGGEEFRRHPEPLTEEQLDEWVRRGSRIYA